MPDPVGLGLQGLGGMWLRRVDKAKVFPTDKAPDGIGRGDRVAVHRAASVAGFDGFPDFAGPLLVVQVPVSWKWDSVSL